MSCWDKRAWAALGLAAALAGGCGGSSGASGNTVVTGSGGSGGAVDGPVQPTTGPYQPMAVNATWTYNVDDKGVKYVKTAVFEAMEDLGGPKAGTMGYRMKETFPSHVQLTWYHQEGTLVVRDHEQSLDGANVLQSEDWYTPYRLRVDETPAHLQSGASWSWSFSDAHTSLSKPASTTQLTETWTVDAIDQPLSVPAGTFATLRLTHHDPTDGSTKTYWFVRGVGKIREETSAGHIEELTSYQIP
jgi:hypothetical protein